MSRYSEADIERAIRTVASLIDRFGDAYWPILERLEQELELRRSRVARLQRYLRTSTSIPDVQSMSDTQLTTLPPRSSYECAKSP
jgi:hypothetical protein